MREISLAQTQYGERGILIKIRGMSLATAQFGEPAVFFLKVSMSNNKQQE